MKRNLNALSLGLSVALLACLASPAPMLAQPNADKPPHDWVFNGKGQKTDQPVFADAVSSDALYPINLNNHWGLMNQDGQVIVYPRFDWTDYSYEGTSRYVDEGKTGFLRGDPADDDDPNEFFIKARYEYADRFSSGAAIVMDEDRWGLIDKAGKELLPMQYDGVLRMQDGFAAVEKDGLCGFVNRAGKLTIPMQFQRVRSFHNGYAAVMLDSGQWAYIDKRGKVVWQDNSAKVQQLGDFHEQYARVRVKTKAGAKWGYLTKSFRLQIDPVFEDARDFSNGYAAAKQGGKWGFIDGRGKWRIEPTFDEADDFDDAVASNDFGDAERVADDRQGRDLSTAGLYAMVRVGDRWGYIDRRGKGALVPQFKHAQPFFRGLARVDRDDSFAYVAETGKVRWDPRVALELGLIDLSAPERGRIAVGRSRTDELGNRVIPAPRLRDLAEVPYLPEHEYAEELPVTD